MRNRLLVVEDSEAMRRYVGDTLRDEGFWVQEARDGAHALRELERQHIDLVVTDLSMPNVDGYQLIERLRSTPHHRRLPVVVLACDVDEAQQERVCAAGAHAAISKPFRRKELIETIRGLLD